MSTLTTGRAMAFERLLKEDAIMLPQYRKMGGRGIFLAKALNKPFDFIRSDTGYSKTLDFLPSIKWNAKLLEVGGATIVDDGTLVSAGVTSIVSKDVDAVTLDSYAIPAAVQALTGYGWSAGTAYNYIDFERKKYVQRVGAIDLGSIPYQTATINNEKAGFRTTVATRIPDMKVPAESTDVLNALSVPFYGESYNHMFWQDVDKCCCVTSTGNFFLYDSSMSSLTAAQFRTAMDGVMLYYELAETVETDISAYLTDDNTMLVESGGTLTFTNANQIPVPSKIEYIRRIEGNNP